MVKEFEKGNIPTISLKALQEISYSTNDSVYIFLFGTPSWCDPCKEAIDTLQKVTSILGIKKSRTLIVIWPEKKDAIKKTIEYFVKRKITIEKAFCFTKKEINTFRNIDDIASFPILFVYKNSKLKTEIDFLDWGQSADYIANKIRNSIERQ